MNINELRVTVYIKQDLKSRNSFEEIGKLVNYSMNKNDNMKKLHLKKKSFKHYCLSGLYPVDKIYKEDECYTFMIRSYKKDMINNLQKCLDGLENDVFVVIDTQIKVYKYSNNIKYIDTITPTIITHLERQQSWNILKDDKDYFCSRLFENLNNKYNSLENIVQHFDYDNIIDKVEFKNKCAIIVEYKGVKFLGNKIRIYFKENNIAQQFANLCIAEGVGEKNSSFGQGFCKPYFK